MSGQLKKRIALVASLLVVGAAIAVPTLWKSSDIVWPGSAIKQTDFSSATLYARNPIVGDSVMFLLDTPDVEEGKTIRVTGFAADHKKKNEIRLIGARTYNRKNFGGAALMGWQTSNGDELDPHQQPSVNLVGSTLKGAGDPDDFVMVEFAVCAAGTHTISELYVTYEYGSHTYKQTLKVAWEVRDALAGVPCGAG